MARKRVEPTWNTWEEADERLREMCNLTSAQQKDEAELNKKLTAIREQFEGRMHERAGALAALEAQMEIFCERHRSEFGDKKSRELVHGVVSYRTHPPAVKLLNRKWNWGAVLDALKAQFARFVRTKEEPDKDAILAAYASSNIDDGELAGVGLMVDQSESFGIELRLDEAAQATARKAG